MRRIILILCLLCAHWAARGQAQYDYRYWFDGNETTQRTGTSASPSWRMDVPLEGLAYTFHTLHFQVKDTAWSTPVTRYFMKLPEKGPQTFTYWFDHAGGKAQPLTPADGTALIDVASLAEGLHTLHMAYGEGAHTGLPRNAIFWKLPIEGQLQYRLWADNDRTLLQAGHYTGAPLMVDVSQMEDGFHTLHAQVEGQASASIPYTKMFIKVPQTEGVDYLTCLFTVDNKLYKQEKVPSAGGLVHWEFDASAIPQGLHKAQGLVVTPSGVATNVQESFFYRTMTTTEKASMQCYYSIDSDTHRTQAGRLDGDLFHFDLDVAGLSDGFHRLSYMLMGNDGTSSRVLTAFFFKTPLGGNGITQYNYWLNDNEDQMHVTELEQRTAPFKLVTLLPVETCPIRSSCFQFEVEDGQPMLYARNDFHMRFYDVSGRITEATEQFVDYKVSRKVTGVEPLEGAEGQARHKKPEKDGILWYSVEAAIGDSLAIRSNQACTVQIFAPDGEEVYTASGAESVGYGGCHAYKDGTYYVALHDVTATQSGDIALDYQHIDKYAVLEYSPASFGTPSAVNVALFGNGFSDTTRIALYQKDNVAYWAQAVTTHSLSELTAHFDIPDSLNGAYSLKILYTEKDSICIADAINTSPRDSVPEVSITLEGNPYFLAGTSATYQVKFTNHSNIPVYNLPFTLSIYCQDGENAISGLKFGEGIGKESKESFRDWLGAYLNETETEQLIQCLYGNDDLKHFFQWTDSTNGKIYLVGHFALPYLNANSTLSIPLTITKATHNFTLYASTKKNWDFDGKVNRNRNGIEGGTIRPRNEGGYGNNGDDECCVMWAATCITTVVTSVVPMSEAVDALAGSCISNFLENRIGGIFSDFFCEGEATDFTKQPKSTQTIWIDITQSVIQCTFESILSAKGEEAAKKWLNSLKKGLGGKVFAIKDVGEDCFINPLKTWVSGCGDDDDDDADADPINSYDPNDIYGYQAPSGSKTVKKDLEEVYYTIEFENDPEFATTSAHEVTVTDTLDRSRFDLDSFRPTSLKIGNRHVELDGTPSTIKTVDMRPEVNAIAQMELSYNADKGIAKWKFISLDPMTMEPTDNPMSGFLPVNTDGNGIGEVSFHIGLLPALDDGELIENRAAIVFDQNEPIITPTWTNVMDTIAPTSTIAACEARNDSTMILHFEASDNRSGVWKYDLYAQEGTEAPWIKVAEDVKSDQYEFKGFSGINYGFCVVATDSAGNVEPKVLEREISQPTFKNGDANGDGVVDVLDATLAIGKYLGKDVHLNFDATDVNKDGIIDAMDVSLIRQIYLSTIVRTRTMIEPRTRIKNIK